MEKNMDYKLVLSTFIDQTLINVNVTFVAYTFFYISSNKAFLPSDQPFCNLESVLPYYDYFKISFP